MALLRLGALFPPAVSWHPAVSASQRSLRTHLPEGMDLANAAAIRLTILNGDQLVRLGCFDNDQGTVQSISAPITPYRAKSASQYLTDASQNSRKRGAEVAASRTPKLRLEYFWRATACCSSLVIQPTGHEPIMGIIGSVI